MVSEYIQHCFALQEGHLLAVSAVGHRFSVVIFECDMSEFFVGNVLQEDPFDVELTLPFIFLCPGIKLLIDINTVDHLSHSQELATGVHTEKQLEGTFVAVFSPGSH